jgi:DNA-binding MarR family transcriptional regulator
MPRLGPEPSPARRRAGKALRVEWTDIGRFAEAIMLARRELLAAARFVRDEYSLGPRGTWIIGLIATGRIETQSDVVKRYKVGRSIIAEEMALLATAGLVGTEQSRSDRRQLDLKLTETGERANARIGEALAARMEERLAGYSVEDVRFCTNLLLGLGADPGR